LNGFDHFGKIEIIKHFLFNDFKYLAIPLFCIEIFKHFKSVQTLQKLRQFLFWIAPFDEEGRFQLCICICDLGGLFGQQIA